MFAVTEAEVVLIRAAYDDGGEFTAAVELRCGFPGITDNAKARERSRITAGWTPIAVPPATGLGSASVRASRLLACWPTA